jgi:hypothetical protein
MKRTIILGLSLILLAVMATGCEVRSFPPLTTANYVVVYQAGDNTNYLVGQIGYNGGYGGNIYANYNDAVIDAKAHAPAYIFKLYSKVEVPSTPVVTPVNP